MCNKIDNDVAPNVNDAKLMELGLVYGDILAYRQKFPVASSSKTKSYYERAEELKTRIKRSHTIGTDKLNRNVKVSQTVKVTFGLKCLEKKQYVSKRAKSTSLDCSRSDTYNDLHRAARNHYKVAKCKRTYLGHFDGEQLNSDSFQNLEHLYLMQKDKKKALHLYLYYPDTYGNLEFKALLQSCEKDSESEDSDDESLDLCPVQVYNVPTSLSKAELTYHVSFEGTVVCLMPLFIKGRM